MHAHKAKKLFFFYNWLASEINDCLHLSAMNLNGKQLNVRAKTKHALFNWYIYAKQQCSQTQNNLPSAQPKCEKVCEYQIPIKGAQPRVTFSGALFTSCSV